MRARWTVILVLAAATQARGGDLAIIVNPAQPVTELSMAQLSRIFRLDQQRWKSGDRVDLVVQLSRSDKQHVVEERIYHMEAEELRRFWMGKVFRGELTAAPRAFSSDASVKDYVAANAQALGYIDSVLLDDTVKALRIDGKRPGEEGYPLARTSR
jgi:ABC-type phosphate transport system substrate-binding protein